MKARNLEEFLSIYAVQTVPDALVISTSLARDPFVAS